MEEQLFENRTDLDKLATSAEAIRAEVSKLVVGQDRMVNLLITAILCDGHVLIEGVPGVAKTLTAKALSKTISAGFSRIQFTPDLMPSDVLGTSVFNMKTTDFDFKKGPIFSNIILIDEINRAPAKTQSSLFEVMEERQVTIDGQTYLMGKPFMVLATQNPVEQEGTYRLPEAQLDRFLFKIDVTYPSRKEEVQMLYNHHKRKGAPDLSVINAVLDPEKIENFRAIVQNIHVEDKIIDYIAAIVEQTRNDRSVFLGASPRAAVALLSASKAYAALSARDFVTPEDIKELAPAIFRHRIILTPEKEMEGVPTDEVITNLINAIEVPR
ncbi:MoxR family ATPase [Cytophagaceae bacterium ABcell3]|nr:MoxR family ATPase [Cytophagaceae bacterium ABcell3]